MGIGYLGSYVAVGLGFVVPADHRTLVFPIIAASFLLFAVPCFLFVPERGNPHPQRIFGWRVIKESTAQTMSALKSGHQYPGLLRFLVGRVFYTDAINTVISYMALYTVNVSVASGLSQEGGRARAQIVLMAAITCAVIGGLVWGRVVDRIGPKRTLTAVLYLWIGTFALAVLIGVFRLPPVFLFIVASAAGVALGGIWSADRPYMLRLTPPDRVGEFYGLYGMVGRFSAITGPLLWSAIYYVSVEHGGLAPLTGQALAITSLLAMVVVSYVILRPVTDDLRDWESLRGRSMGRNALVG